MAKLALAKLAFIVVICLATFQLNGEEVFIAGENDDLQTVINNAMNYDEDPEVRVLIQKSSIELGYLSQLEINRFIFINFTNESVQKLTLQGDSSYNPQIIFNQPHQSPTNCAIKVSGITGNNDPQNIVVIDNVDFTYIGESSGYHGIELFYGLKTCELRNCSFSDIDCGLFYHQYNAPAVSNITIDSCSINQPEYWGDPSLYGTSLYHIRYVTNNHDSEDNTIPAHVQISNNTLTGVAFLGAISTTNIEASIDIYENVLSYHIPVSTYTDCAALQAHNDPTINGYFTATTINVYNNCFENWSLDINGMNSNIYSNIFKKVVSNYQINYFIDLDAAPHLCDPPEHLFTKIYRNEFYGCAKFAIFVRHVYGAGLNSQTLLASIDYNSFFGSGGVMEIETEPDHLNGPQIIPSFSNNLIACEGYPINNVSENCAINVWYYANYIHVDDVILTIPIDIIKCVFESEDLYVNLNSFSKVGCYTENELYEVDYVNGSYNLLWTTEDKCKAINNGIPMPDLGILEDADGTPPDIGAVYYPHNHQEYVFPSFWPSGAKIKWMSFPVIDDRSYTAPRHWNELGYMFDAHMDDPPANQIETASWSYGNYTGEMSYLNGDWLLSDYHATQPKGFKLVFNQNVTTIDPVVVNGFKADAVTTPVELYNGTNNNFENWIGYFVPYTQGAGSAFGKYLPGSTREKYIDYIYSIKTQTWGTRRMFPVAGSPWIVDPNRYTLSEGDMVSILLLPHAPEEMFWYITLQSETPRIRDTAVNFSYTEELDYTPIFIEFDPNDLPDEVGLMVAGECKGAAVVDSSLIEVNYYASAAKGEDDTIEVMFYYGGKGTKQDPDTKVYNPETMLFEDGKLKTSQLGQYGYISFNRSEGSTLVPLVTELKQNYPNPFKGITNISWVLEKEEPISVDIYNLKGQKVTTLFDGLGKKGRQVLSWDSRDKNGQSVASGIYFYRLNTPEGSKVQKMMVMR